jgi:hypothetical protein
VVLEIRDQLLIRTFDSSNTVVKLEYNESVHQLFVDFKKSYDSIKRE